MLDPSHLAFKQDQTSGLSYLAIPPGRYKDTALYFYGLFLVCGSLFSCECDLLDVPSWLDSLPWLETSSLDQTLGKIATLE